MHEECAHSDGVRDARNTQYGVLERRGAEPLSLMTMIHREPAKQDNGDRIRHVAPYWAWGLVRADVHPFRGRPARTR